MYNKIRCGLSRFPTTCSRWSPTLKVGHSPTWKKTKTEMCCSISAWSSSPTYIMFTSGLLYLRVYINPSYAITPGSPPITLMLFKYGFRRLRIFAAQYEHPPCMYQVENWLPSGFSFTRPLMLTLPLRCGVQLSRITRPVLLFDKR